METIRKHNKIIIFGSILVIIGCFLALLYPFWYQYRCETRTFPEMERQVGEAMPAAVGIVRISSDEEGVSYSPGSSGVIIERKGDVCLALTAYHVVADGASEYRIFTVDTEGYDQYAKKVRGSSGGHVPQAEYYGAMPEAEVMKTSPESDLALIRFETDDEVCAAKVSEKDPSKGDWLAVIGNPSGEKFRVSYGTIRSGHTELFDPGEGIPNQILRHNAYEAPGSSGSAAFNEDGEVAGINIGGGRSPLGCFKYGAMIPAIQIRAFLGAD